MAVSLSMYITENSTSISNNTSSVTVDCYVSWTYGSWNNYGQCDAAITIDGTSYSFSGLKFNSSHTTSGSQWLMSKTANVYHNADGYKTVYCSAWFNTNVSSGTIYASGSKVLTYIPRAATLTAAPNFTDEDSPTISYSNPAGSVVTSLQACIASTDGATIYVPYRDLSKSGSSYTFNFTSTEQSTLQNACVNSKSMEMRFYVKTVIAGNTYYSSLTKTLTIANAAPTLSPTATDTNSKSVALTGSASGTLVKGYNTVSYAFNAAALKGATLKSYKVTCGDKTGTAAQGTLSNVESGSVVFTVTDSRGNTTTKTLTKTLISYVPVTANVSGKISLSESDNTKATVSFTVSGNYFKGSFGATSNTLTLTYSLLNSSNNEAAQGTLTIPTSAYSGTTYNLSYSIPTAVDYKDSYTVKVTAADKLYTVVGTSKTLKAIPVFDWSETDFAFNVPVTIGGNLTVNGTISTSGTVDTADFVVEQGTDNGWSYRIWNSGRREGWLTYLVSSVACTTAFGNLYRTDSIQLPMSDKVFANDGDDAATFVSDFHSFHFYSNQGTPAWVWDDVGTKSATKFAPKLVRPTSTTISGYFECYVNVHP